MPELGETTVKYRCSNCGGRLSTAWVHRINGEYKGICENPVCIEKLGGSPETGVVVEIEEV